MHLQGLAGGDKNEATAKAMVADIRKIFDSVTSTSKESSQTCKYTEPARVPALSCRYKLQTHKLACR